MLAPIALPLSIPIDNPSPLTLTLGAISIVAFGVELAFARRRLPHYAGLSVLLMDCLLVAAMLVLWAAYYAVSGPADAEPVVHLTGAHDPYFDFYRTMWIVNIVVTFLLAALAVVIGASERHSARSQSPSALTRTAPRGVAVGLRFVLSCRYLPHGAVHRERTARRGWRASSQRAACGAGGGLRVRPGPQFRYGGCAVRR